MTMTETIICTRTEQAQSFLCNLWKSFFQQVLPTTTVLCLCGEIMQRTCCIYYPFACPFIMRSSFLSSCQCFFHCFMCVRPPYNSLLPWFVSQRDSFLQIIGEVCICLRIKTMAKHANCKQVPRCLALSQRKGEVPTTAKKDHYTEKKWDPLTETPVWVPSKIPYSLSLPVSSLSHDCCSGFHFQINIWHLYPKRQTNMQRKFCLSKWTLLFKILWLDEWISDNSDE